MPAYRHERYVGLAIESILGQTRGDFELLIADDCSDDLCYEVIRSYDDPRIHAVRLEHRSGVSVALNASLARARGTYIAFCASDDLWLPEKLERQVAFLQAHGDIGAVFCRPWQIDPDGARVDDAAHPLGRVFAQASRTNWLAAFFFSGNCLCAVTPLLRGEAMRAIGPFNPLLLQLQDLEYWIRFASRYEIHLSGERLAEYRVVADASNLSALTPERFARVLYETYQVLKLYARGPAAEAVCAVQLDCAPAFDWRPQAPSIELRLANHALQVGLAPHLLFALDRLYDYGRSDASLAAAPDEPRLFTQALFALTGSPRMQSLFGTANPTSHAQAMEGQQRQLAGVEAELAALKAKLAAKPESLGARLRRAFGPDSGG